MTVGEDMDLEAQLRQHRNGPPPMGETKPWDFVYRLLERVEIPPNAIAGSRKC